MVDAELDVRGLEALLTSRIGQDFDGECHLTEAEVRSIIAYLSASDALAKVTAERDALREIVSQCAASTGAYCSPKASIEFMSLVPSEIKLCRDSAAADLAEAVKVIEPFAAVAEHDIGRTENDEDCFRPMSSHNRAPLLRVGQLRAARAFIAARKGGE